MHIRRSSPENLKYLVTKDGISCILEEHYIDYAMSSIIIMMCRKGIRTVANLWVICPRHIGFGLTNARVASGQREPSTIDHEYIVHLAASLMYSCKILT